MSDDSPRQGRSWWTDPQSLRALQSRLVVLALITTSVLLALAGLSIPGGASDSGNAANPSGASIDRVGGQVGDAAARPAFDGALLPSEVGDPVVRRQALVEQLRARASAVLARNAGAYLASVDPDNPRARQAAAQTQSRLAALPFAAYDYSITDVTSDLGGTDVDPSARAYAQVDLTYQLTAFDPLPARVSLTIEFVHRDDGWKIVTESSRGLGRAPWQAGDLQVIRGAHSLVIGVGGSSRDAARSKLVAYSRTADRAVTAVSRVWGTGWNQRVVLVIPSTTSTLASLLGRTTDSLDKIAAITTDETGSQDRPTPGQNGSTQNGSTQNGSTQNGSTQGAERVWVNAALMSTLSPQGRAIVLRHEILHVASDAPAVAATPLWLEEGLAELVGYAGSGVRLPVALQELIVDAKAGQYPRKLARSDDFGPTSAGLAQAYEESHLAMVLIASKIGTQGLVRLYRDVAAGDPRTPDDNFAQALSDATGWDDAGLLGAMRDQLRAFANS